MNLAEFFDGVCAELKAPTANANNHFILGAFAYSEYGNQNALERWNPLNTTLNMGGGTTDFNEVGVKIYTSARDGVDATARTLLNGFYSAWVANLQTGAGVDAYGSADIAREFQTWQGGSDLALHCIHTFSQEFVQSYLDSCTRDDEQPQPSPTPAPPPQPGWMSQVKWGKFVGFVSATSGANVRGGPGVDFPILRGLAHGVRLDFDGYVHRGDAIRDVITGGLDDRWFHISRASGYGWIASAIVNGNPNF